MEVAEYTTMADLEATYWWYRGQRGMVLDCLATLPRADDAPILDAGCGTGRLGAAVARRLGAQVIGIDLSAHAARFWPRGGTDAWAGVRSTTDRLPFADASFSIIYSIDVLCCCEVDAERACDEFARVLRPEGHLVLVLPAYPSLLSEHDAAVHCTRRFDRRGVRRMLAAAGLHAERVTHLFPTFFPAIAAVRLLKRSRGRAANGAARSDVRPIPSAVNAVLYGLTQIERALVRRVNFPVGTSLLAVARKHEAPPLARGAG